MEENEKEVEQNTEEKKKDVKRIIGSVVEAAIVITVGGVLGGYLGGCIRKREADKLRHNTSIEAFQHTITWFDKTFDHLNLRELWDTFAKENPDKISYIIK